MNPLHPVQLVASIFAGAGLMAVTVASAQPASALGGPPTGAPQSSLHGSPVFNQPPQQGAQPVPTWTPRNAMHTDAPALQSAPVQQTNLPVDLAKLNDAAIIIIGGKPTAAGDVKRAVLALDDKAIIIIGGKQVPAATMKRELAGLVASKEAAGMRSDAAARQEAAAKEAAANAREAASASNRSWPTIGPLLGSDSGTGDRATAHAPLGAAAASNIHPGVDTSTPHVKPIKVPPLSQPIASKKRVQLLAASGQVRIEQDRLAQLALTSHAAAPGVTAAAVGSIAHDPRVTGTEQVPRAGIFSVNNHTTTSPHLTPGGKVGIWGMGFGATPGIVTLVDNAFERSPINLQVVGWTTDTIQAVVPGGIRGVPDVNGAVLQVTTAAGKSYRFDNVSFVAAREEQTITDPRKMLMFVPSITSSSSWTAQGQIGHMRWSSGKSIDCPGIGTDTIHFQTVRGFDAIGATMSHGRTDSGDGDADGWPGSRVFSGTYAFGDWVNQDLQVSWGVFRSHTSPRTYLSLDGTVWSDPFYGAYYAAVFVATPTMGAAEATGQTAQGVNFSPIHSRDSYDECESGWVLTSLTLWGPAGVAP